MSDSQPAGTSAQPSSHARSFLANVFWNWGGAIVNIVIAVFLSPFIIRKLGTERFGIWALVFSVIDYLRLFDLGFRAAMINYCARHRARGEDGQVNEVINTGLFYFTAVSAVILLVCVGASRGFSDVFHVSNAYRQECATLVWIVGASTAISLTFSGVSGALEAFQRFDLTNRAYIVTLLLRTAAWVILLQQGYGLVAMGLVSLASQGIERGWNLYSLWRVFPALRISPVLARLSRLRAMGGYSFHSFLIGMSNLNMNQSPAALIGYFGTPTEVAYWNVPMRLLLYIGELAPRVGYVTTAKAAELDESGKVTDLRRLATFTNRYCFALFVPVALFLLTYGRELIRVWINPEFAAHSAPLLPILTIAIVVTMAGQFNSGAILIGQGKHRGYAYGLVVEAILCIAILAYAVPRYGILGAAWVVGILLLFSRGLLPAWQLARRNRFSLIGYAGDIYLRPALTAAAMAPLCWWMKSRLLPGRNWPELIAGGVLITVAYLGAAVFTCADRKHRQRLFALAARRR